MAKTLDELARRAVAGDKRALESLALELKDDIYGLAMRMLSYPADAQDATQDILIKIITHLSQFRGESSFRTWAWAIATRHLMTVRKGARESFVNFDLITQMIRAGDDSGPDSRDDAEAMLLAEEVKIGCTGAMLVALDRDQRIAWVLSEIVGMDGAEAARVLSITPATYRKRLERARKKLTEYISGVCGLVNPKESCNCRRQIDVNIRAGTVDPKNLIYMTHPTRRVPSPRQRLKETLELESVIDVYRSHPDFVAPDKVMGAIRSLISSGKYAMFNE
jgi:RNA polymerase sigma factor (sigma-70 family)